MISTELAPGRVRRSYSKDFKRQVVAQCREAGNSVAGVALKHGLNANVVHKWLRVHEAGAVATATPSFIELPCARPAAAGVAPATIRIEVQRGDTRVAIHWPSTDAAACAAWLSEWLR